LGCLMFISFSRFRSSLRGPSLVTIGMQLKSLMARGRVMLFGH